jgi:diacylglycerol O-acyltransferase
VIERASPTDRAFLAMDSGAVPEQFGVILLLDRAAGFDLSGARRLIAERIPAVPRLRQRLIRTPFGCGGPIWVDDAGFDIGSHVRAVACGEPGDERALLDTALAVIATRPRRTAPLWSAVLVTGLADSRVALVLVLHHVLADGVGGLAVLANLLDSRADAPAVCFPRPTPTAARLSPMLVAVPATGDAGRRLEQVAAQVRAHKAAATGPPRSPCWAGCSGRWPRSAATTG